MALPRVIIGFSNGNLLQQIALLDGVGGLVTTVSTVGLIGLCQKVSNLDDAVTKGYDSVAEPFAYRQIKEFYDEVAGNKDLWVMGVADTTTMATMLDYTNANGANKLITASQGAIRLLAVCRKPAVGYAPGVNFFDADVSAAVAAAKTFVTAQNAANNFLRVLIEGRVAVEGSNTIYSPSTAANGFAGVVLGGSANDGSASVGTALGRAVAYAAHIKLGKVANGPLAISTVFIGTKLLKDVLNLTALHDAGLISFMQHPNKAGFFFGIDHMASTDDYRLLAYGRVIDKAALIAVATYVEELEGEVDVDATGNISELDLKHMEGKMKQNIDANMGGQISSSRVYINPSQNIVGNNKTAVVVSVKPKGYNSEIDATIGLIA